MNASPAQIKRNIEAWQREHVRRAERIAVRVAVTDIATVADAVETAQYLARLERERPTFGIPVLS